VASQVVDRSLSTPPTPPRSADTSLRGSGEGIATAPKTSILPAESQPAPPTDELSPGAPARPSQSLPPSLSHSLTRSEAALEIAHGPTAGKRIALTFDAGSSAAPTPAILEALRANGLRCTFFLTGRWTETNPGVVRQIVDAGHELGNHTYTHPDLTHVSDEKVKSELQQTEEEVQRVTGRSTKPYFRPPFGARDARVLRLAAAEGYRCIYWTTDSWDSVKKGIRPREIEERVLHKARPGSIILMHCGSQATADALPDIIRSLKEEGYEIVTVSDLLNTP
jgi:peptidoglycan/xylan/chitin deacetylase (PgdA/CDA1 family)